MRLYRNTYCNEESQCVTMYFSSKANADKAWVHVRRTGEVVPNADAWPVTNGFHSVRSEAVEVPTKKADLIDFLNSDYVS